MKRPARLVIVGGSDAGISAGLRARELDHDLQVALVVADAYPNFSICGIPFWVSGEVTDWRSLAHRTHEDLLAAGLQLALNTTAVAVYPDEHEIAVIHGGDDHELMAYDRLVIATGAKPARPPWPGLDLPGVHLLHSMDDAFAVQTTLEAGARSAVIVGGGYIGVEMADALTLRGLQVTLLEQADHILGTVDGELSRIVEDELEANEVNCVTGVRVSGIARDDRGLIVLREDGLHERADLVLVVTGVQPDTALGTDAGIAAGVRGALTVDRQMRTNVPDVLAAGDCIETYHQLLERPVYMPLGSTAHKQGRIAGENALGGNAEYAGSLGTQVVKVFDLAIAATGLREPAAREHGFDPLTVQTTTDDHKAYYPGAQPLHIRIVGERTTGRLLGAQILGHVEGQVAKRIDTLATAIHHRMSIAELSALDLSYTPPLSAPWDPIQTAAQAWEQTRHAPTNNKPVALA